MIVYVQHACTLHMNIAKENASFTLPVVCMENNINCLVGLSLSSECWVEDWFGKKIYVVVENV